MKRSTSAAVPPSFRFCRVLRQLLSSVPSDLPRGFSSTPTPLNASRISPCLLYTSFGWIQGRGVGTIGEMTDLPKAFRAKLEENATLTTLSMRRRRASKLDGTIKYLFELPDGETIETVRMVYHHGGSPPASTDRG